MMGATHETLTSKVCLFWGCPNLLPKHHVHGSTHSAMRMPHAPPGEEVTGRSGLAVLNQLRVQVFSGQLCQLCKEKPLYPAGFTKKEVTAISRILPRRL